MVLVEVGSRMRGSRRCGGGGLLRPLDCGCGHQVGVLDGWLLW